MKKIVGIITCIVVFVLVSSAVFTASEDMPENEGSEEVPLRGTRGYAQASDIKVDVKGVSGELYNLAGIGGNESEYSLFCQRNWTHQYLSNDNISFYDTVWHPEKSYSYVVGANHSYPGGTPTRAPALFKYEGSTYTDLCDLTTFDGSDWFWGVDFKPNGALALIVGDYGAIYKIYDGNNTLSTIQDSDSANRTYYDVEFTANGTYGLVVGYNKTAGAGIIDCYYSNGTVSNIYSNASHDAYRCISINSTGYALIGSESGEILVYNITDDVMTLINDTDQSWYGCDWNRADTNSTLVGDGDMLYSTDGTDFWAERSYNATNMTLWDVAWNRNDSYALVVGEGGVAYEWDATTLTNVSHNITNITYYCINWVNVNFTYSGVYRHISTVIAIQVSVSSGSKSGIAVSYTIERLGITHRAGSGTTDTYGNYIVEWNSDLPDPFFYTVRTWVTNKATVENTTQVLVATNPGIWIYFQNSPESVRQNEWTSEFQIFSNSSLYNVSNANATLRIRKYLNRVFSNLYSKNVQTDAYGKYVLSSGPTLTTAKYVLNNYYIAELHLYNHTGSGYGSDDVKIDFNGDTGSPNSHRGTDSDRGPNGTYRPLWMDEGHYWYYQDNNSDGAYTINNMYSEPLMCSNITNILYLVGTGQTWIPLSSATNWLSFYWNDYNNATHINLHYDNGEDIYLDSGDGKLNVTGSYPDEGFNGTYFLSTYHCFKVTTPATLSRSESISVNLTAGWNLIGMPEGMTTATLGAKSTHIYSIVHRTAGGTSGYYVTYTKAVGITAFTMTKFEGVYIYTNQTCTITFTETIA